MPRIVFGHAYSSYPNLLKLLAHLVAECDIHM